jgi:hypothetical protein
MAGERAAHSFFFINFVQQRLTRTKLLMPATSYAQTLAVIGPGQFGHLTVDTLLTKISHGDKRTTSGQLGLYKN